MPNQRIAKILSTSLLLLLLLSAFISRPAPQFAGALLGGRTYDESHDFGYIDWAGSVGYANIMHRDSICPITCWDTVTQISDGSQVSGAFDRDVVSFDMLVAIAPNQGYGTATLSACSAATSGNLNAGTGSTPGYIKIFLVVPAGCRNWSLSASGGNVYLAALDVVYSVVILPPVISGALNCSLPGSNGWCIGALALDLTASDPQGQAVIISGDVDGLAFSCPAGNTTCSIPLTTERIGTVNYTVNSATGFSSSGSTTYKLDTSTPQLTESLSGANGANGWFVSDVIFSASAVDAVSGLAALESSTDGGAWTSYAAPVTLSDGIHTIQFRATDNAGNVTTGALQTISVDTITPVLNSSVTGAAGLNGWYVSNTQVSATASDAGSGLSMFEVTTDGGASWAVYSAATVFSDGIHTIQFRATDYAGNVTTSAEQTISVDTITPALNSTVSGVAGTNGWYVSNTQVSASATDLGSGLATLEVSQDGSAYANYQSPIIFTDGIHSIQFRATDNAGNVTTNAAQTVKVDTLTPALSVSVGGTAGLNGWYVSITQVSAVSSDSGSGIASLQASQNGAAYTPYNQAILFADGLNTYRFKATDNAGNVTETPVQNLKVDTIPPFISMTETLSLGEAVDYSLEDYGSGLSIYRAVIEDDAEKYKKVVWLENISGVKQEGQIRWDGKFADGVKAGVGEYFITLKISDAAGNETMKTAVVSVNLLNSLLPILPFTPPTTAALTPSPLPEGEGESSNFGGTTSEPTGEVSSSPSTTGGGNSESTGEVTTTPSSAGGTRAEGRVVSSQTWTKPSQSASFPIPDTGILWGAASAAAVGYFLSEAQKRKEEEEQKEAEARRALDLAHAAEQESLEGMNAELRRQEEEERIEREEREERREAREAPQTSNATAAKKGGRSVATLAQNVTKTAFIVMKNFGKIPSQALKVKLIRGVISINWDCIINLGLLLANALGTIFVLTGVFAEFGAALLIINVIAQLLQIAGDVYGFLINQISLEKFRLYLLLNVLDAVPGVGVLSGIFGCIRVCILDWIFNFLNKK